MDGADPIASLYEDDQLSLWLGRVVREHALLEYSLNNVHGMLAPEGAVPPRGSVGPLIGNCKELLTRSDLQADLVAAGQQALRAAAFAAACRNQLVHDMWLDDPLRSRDDPARWNTFSRVSPEASYASATLRDLRTVRDAHIKLVRVRVRVSALFMALHEVLPRDQAVDGPPARSEMRRYVAMMNDDFTFAPNGNVQVDLSEDSPH